MSLEAGIMLDSAICCCCFDETFIALDSAAVPPSSFSSPLSQHRLCPLPASHTTRLASLTLLVDCHLLHFTLAPVSGAIAARATTRYLARARSHYRTPSSTTRLVRPTTMATATLRAPVKPPLIKKGSYEGQLPSCWGHRGVSASAAFPENTLASFEAAIRDGAEGIESGKSRLGDSGSERWLSAPGPALISPNTPGSVATGGEVHCDDEAEGTALHCATWTTYRPGMPEADVHITEDSEIVMFHDPHLDRTTNGTGRIQTQKYYGVLDKLVTNKSPQQKIPTFRETIELLMRPNNRSVFLNIDVKVDNDPERLFKLMHEIIAQYPDYETVLGPRLVLGLWHPKYVEPAVRLLPYMKRAHIGLSPGLARKYFWEACSSFSMNFSCLVGGDGEAFRRECKAAGKDLYVWTVNERREMIEATKWGVKAILTDRTAEFLKLREQIEDDWPSVSRETSWKFAYTSFWYSSLANFFISRYELYVLTATAGEFKLVR
ncbi:BZ3500_MvSof-1268-A1-R1_Chr5-3g08192 [Microbotryum saponariae]|uniref:BZ3500_MvSof-1268-A1-R1_Chr5-3g08192 protein n=1 Tax=Microbotryum saponariae TaxID=289078 RepID=A0A2X0LLD6_9BASI|nr:BZ3500_MvSof-1268-A1-R1_Chr5-3g08192 [Microbotryum saponariae]SDA07951.1 BZ3501_MvSof-1269-A2-R1_Chr5-1g07336 [Microbotryum saponariae]